MKKLLLLLIAILQLTALVVSTAFGQKSEHLLTASANPFTNKPISLNNKYVSDRGSVFCTYLPIFMTNILQGAITYSAAMQLKNLNTSTSASVQVSYCNQNGSVNSIVNATLPLVKASLFNRHPKASTARLSSALIRY